MLGRGRKVSWSLKIWDSWEIIHLRQSDRPTAASEYGAFEREAQGKGNYCTVTSYGGPHREWRFEQLRRSVQHPSQQLGKSGKKDECVLRAVLTWRYAVAKVEQA